MRLYAIYERPRDHPLHYVVREWRLVEGKIAASPHATLHLTLAAARASIPKGLKPVGRMPDDDPCIREVWL